MGARLGDRDSNPNYLIQSQTFCRLNYTPLRWLTNVKYTTSDGKEQMWGSLICSSPLALPLGGQEGLLLERPLRIVQAFERLFPTDHNHAFKEGRGDFFTS